MGLNSGAHSEKEIEATRCRVIETGISAERARFLRELLELNGQTVKAELEKKTVETAPDTYIIGVTDVTFNPVVAVYQRMLHTKDGRKVTPAYWNQQTSETHPDYWHAGK